MPNKNFDELKGTGALPTPPGVGMEILRISQNENCSVDELAKIIQSDPSLTGRLLQVANSALAGGARPCTTIKEATMRLGLRSVRSIALGFSLVSAHRNGACPVFDYGVFWSQSLARAVAAHVLAARFKVGSPAEVFVAALVSDIGSLALATVHPQQFGEILAKPEAATASGRAALEQQLFGIDHREVAAAMLREWLLPESFAEAAQSVGLVAPPTPDPKRGAGLTTLLWIAARFASAFILPDDKPLDVELVQKALLQLPGCSKEQLPGLWSEMADGWRKWGNMLEIVTMAVPPFGGGVSTRARIGNPLLVTEKSASKEGAKPAAKRGATGNAPAAVPTAGAVPTPPSAAPAAISATVATATTQPTPSTPAIATMPGMGAAAPPAQRARILAVDDDAMSLKLVASLLQRAGHQVTTASNGIEAMKLAMQVVPHVLIADRYMPELDGLQLCRRMRQFEAGRRVYVLLLTGDENEDHIVEAFDGGCDDYIVKPFKPKLLLARVRAGMRVVQLQERVDFDKAQSQRHVAEMGIKERQLQQAAITDVLTDLPNRRYAMELLRDSWKSSTRDDVPLSAIMVDIDKFKRVNDTFGHDIGDLVLKETARVLRTIVEPPACVCRLGGEEFVVVMPGASGERAKEVAEQLRVAVAAHAIRGGSFDGPVNISLGVATRQADVPGFEQLLKLADDGLYRAKENGRNQVRFVQAEGVPVEPLATQPSPVHA